MAQPKKVAVLIESDFYEKEIFYYEHRFPEEGIEVHFLSRLWGQPSITFRGHEEHYPFECHESFALRRRSTRLKNQFFSPCSRPSRSAESEGVRVSALKAEIEIEKAMVSANWRNRMPVVPGKKATGTKTATSTRGAAMTGPVTSFIASEAALTGLGSTSWRWRSMFSMTTMTSSPTRPVASVMPNRVSVLMEKPSSLTKVKVPMSETGMVTAGMIVERQSSRKTKMTRMTRTMAWPRVETTSRMDSPTASVVSKASSYFMPGGKRLERRSSSAMQRRSTSRALAVESWVMPMPTESRPL